MDKFFNTRIFYNDFFGKRTVALPTYNPFKLVSEAVTVKKGLSEKKVSGNIKGEGLVQGGVIIFDKSGKPRYAYEEETGKEMNNYGASWPGDLTA